MAHVCRGCGKCGGDAPAKTGEKPEEPVKTRDKLAGECKYGPVIGADCDTLNSGGKCCKESDGDYARRKALEAQLAAKGKG